MKITAPYFYDVKSDLWVGTFFLSELYLKFLARILLEAEVHSCRTLTYLQVHMKSVYTFNNRIT